MPVKKKKKKKKKKGSHIFTHTKYRHQTGARPKICETARTQNREK